MHSSLGKEKFLPTIEQLFKVLFIKCIAQHFFAYKLNKKRKENLLHFSSIVEILNGISLILLSDYCCLSTNNSSSSSSNSNPFEMRNALIKCEMKNNLIPCRYRITTSILLLLLMIHHVFITFISLHSLFRRNFLLHVLDIFLDILTYVYAHCTFLQHLFYCF